VKRGSPPSNRPLDDRAQQVAQGSDLERGRANACRISRCTAGKCRCHTALSSQSPCWFRQPQPPAVKTVQPAADSPARGPASDRWGGLGRPICWRFRKLNMAAGSEGEVAQYRRTSYAPIAAAAPLEDADGRHGGPVAVVDVHDISTRRQLASMPFRPPWRRRHPVSPPKPAQYRSLGCGSKPASTVAGPLP